MRNANRWRLEGVLVFLVLVLMGCGQSSQTDAKNAIIGGVRIQNEQLAQMPTQPPRTVYVEDFILDYQNVQSDEGIHGRVGVLQRLPSVRPQPNPAEQA